MWPLATTTIQADGAILVTNFSDEYNALYRHDKAFQFTDVSFASQTARASIPLVGWGTHFVDYDNDGWLDVLVVNGHVYPQVEQAGGPIRYAQRKLLYHNNQNGTFTETTSTAGPALSQPSVSRGSAAGDLDNDGDLDVVINNLDGPPTLLRNDGGNRGNFLVVDLEGRTINRGAVGAVVTVSAGGARAARGAARRRQLSVAQRPAPPLRTWHAHEGRFHRSSMAERNRAAVRCGSGKHLHQDRRGRQRAADDCPRSRRGVDDSRPDSDRSDDADQRGSPEGNRFAKQ